MKKWIVVMLFATGCGTIFNKRTAHLSLDQGVEVDGQSISADVDQREEHLVTYADGRTCKLRPGVGASYVILDIFVTGLVGIVVDAVTGDWTVLKGDCDGVYEKK